MTERVLIATSWHHSAVSYQFRSLARSLHEAGVEVHFLDDRRHEGVSVDPWVAGLHRWPGTGRPSGLGAVRFATDLLRQLRPRTVIANFAAVTPLGVAARRTGIETRVCWYHTLSEQTSLDSSGGDRDRAVDRLRHDAARRLRRLTYRCYTDLVAVSGAAADDYTAVYGSRGPTVHVRHNAIADGPHRDRPPAPDAPIVAVGRFDPSKGYDVLVRAAAALDHPRPVVLIGEGAEHDRLAALAGELAVDLELPGTVFHADVRERLARAALVVVPSRAEAFGLVAIEGLAAGVPVVASAVGGLAEIVADGVTGRLVVPDDPTALAAAITDALDPDRNRAMGAAGRVEFLERFEIEAWGASTAAWLLAGPPLAP